MEKKIMFGIGMLVLVLTLSSVSAEFWGCFEKGEVVEYCGGYKDDWTCGSSSGCMKCMSVYRENESCYVHGVWPECNKVAQECSVFNSNHTIDERAPEFVLNSPVDGELYNSRSVLIDFDLDEVADVYYYDNVNGRGNWVRVCSDCSAGSSTYSRERSFGEGLNNLSFRAVDVVGNDVYFDVSFFVDSKEPRIRGTEPRGGFVGSVFSVEYEEDNPEKVALFIRDKVLGVRSFSLDLENCSDGGRYKTCLIDVDLSDYDGKNIGYWFVVEDVAGNSVSSKVVEVMVDESAPEIVRLDYELVGRYVYFEVEIDEANLDEVGYSYFDSRGRLRERRLCSKLVDNVCEKKVSFGDGDHDVSIVVSDEAGHKIAEGISFLVDSKAPKIKKTYPKRGFGNGTFSVDFVEQNPRAVRLSLVGSGPVEEFELGLDDCVVDGPIRQGSNGAGDEWSCSVDVDLSGYHGSEIEYWFNVSDGVGNVDVSKVVDLDVDVEAPVLLNEDDDFYWQGEGRYARYVYFNLSVDEENLDEIVYSYVDSRGRLRERRLCSRLTPVGDGDASNGASGMCSVKKSFRDGDEIVGVSILDEAGNAVVQDINYIVNY